ncbi:putative oxidoreductase protein [Dioscorea alata]|uniref:Oxidoreductase protein n=1 Tax=Dioscorea alata TaxID=55571 RepID=A0ACB7WA38_DIOAL|nr:putative oxidoreductase protein [Dioscorea alata]
MAAPAAVLPQIALIGAGYFARTTYIKNLRQITDRVTLKAIWDLTEESSRALVELARDFAPQVECKWGEEGLNDIMSDDLIIGVAVVVAGQALVDVSLRMLKAGKHVLQEKPAALTVSQGDRALSTYNSIRNNSPYPIWALAENYRFEPAFVEAKKLVKNVGDVLNIKVAIEGYLNSSNPFFSSGWRRNLSTGFLLEMAVHFIAGLRMIIDSEIKTVSSIARHVNKALPPFDTMCTVFQLENGAAGVYAMVVWSVAPKLMWRVDGTKGALQIELNSEFGDFVVSFFSADGQCQTNHYPMIGVIEDLKAFVHDITQATNKDAAVGFKPEERLSYVEGLRDIAVIEAMLESNANNGAQTFVKKFEF